MFMGFQHSDLMKFDSLIFSAKILINDVYWGQLY